MIILISTKTDTNNNNNNTILKASLSDDFGFCASLAICSRSSLSTKRTSYSSAGDNII